MLVIHIDSMQDTTLLKPLYEGLPNCTLLYNPQSQQEVREAIEREPDLVVFLGHGSSEGLFSLDWRGFIFDGSMASLLAGKRCVGIWCYAAEFAAKYGVEGFFSSMFISNAHEAAYFGHRVEDEEVLGEVTWFAHQVNRLLREGTPEREWPELLRNMAHMEKPYVAFNYRGLRYFGK